MIAMLSIGIKQIDRVVEMLFNLIKENENV